MTQQEKQLFKAMCSFRSDSLAKCDVSSATPAVLGHLFFNRMQAVAYGNLQEKGLAGSVGREFRSSLKDAYDKNIEKNNSFFACIRYLTEVLAPAACPYAMLKGAYLCGEYPVGYRTSNDIDLLVLPEDITQISRLLTAAGFAQGYLRGGTFVPASRKEIIQSKMMRGETVPYIKKVDLPAIPYLEVDINFSLDYKNSRDDTVKEMLSRARPQKAGDLTVTTLEPSDFFIHLCSHLYKEATTLPWVEMGRDMSLYKYSDLYLLLSHMGPQEVEQLFSRAKELGLLKVCAFAIVQTLILFDLTNEGARQAAEIVLKDDPDFLHQVFSPKEKKTFVYTEKNIFDRFFSPNRRSLLTEVSGEQGKRRPPSPKERTSET